MRGRSKDGDVKDEGDKEEVQDVRKRAKGRRLEVGKLKIHNGTNVQPDKIVGETARARHSRPAFLFSAPDAFCVLELLFWDK